MPDTPYTIRGWPSGMNNVLPDYELPRNDKDIQTALRNAVNVDVLDSGRVRRRSGITQRISGDTHSLFASGNTAYAAINDYLCNIATDYTSTQLKAVSPNRRISYVDTGEAVYYANGLEKGRLINGAWYRWGVEAPTAPPTMTATAGALGIGRYMAVCTFIDTNGQESGCGSAGVISLTGIGGITFGLPQPIDSSGVLAIRLYMTSANDDVLYSAVDLAVGTTTFTILSAPTPGLALETQFMREFLPCELLEYYHGRIYGAHGNILWHTQPYRYGLYRPSQDYIQFPAPITMIAAVDDGMYVAADQTYWMPGAGPEDFAIFPVLQYTAAQGSMSRMPDAQHVVWFSSAGLVMAAPGGVVKMVQEPNVRTASSTKGTTVYVEQNGVKKILGLVNGDPFATTLAATDFMDAEIIRARR